MTFDFEAYKTLFELLNTDGPYEIEYSLQDGTYYSSEEDEELPLSDEHKAMLADVEHVDSHHIGDGKACWVVFRHKPTDTYFGYYGWYSSYGGSEFEDISLMDTYSVTYYKTKC